MTETQLWQRVKQGLEGIRRRDETQKPIHLSRVENLAGSGISDVSACYCGSEAWLELKVFSGKRLHFRNSQRIWILERSEAGGRCLVLASIDDELILWHADDLVRIPHEPGSDGKSFWVRPLDIEGFFPITVVEKPIPWEKLRDKIFDTVE